jgi:hypothetical protein
MGVCGSGYGGLLMASVSDNFNRADGAVGSSWYSVGGAQCKAESNGFATYDGATWNTLGYARYNTELSTDNIAVQATYLEDRAGLLGIGPASGGGGNTLGIYISSSTLAFCQIATGGGAPYTGNLHLFGGSYVSGDVMRVERNGTVWTVYKNGTPFAWTYNDTAPVVPKGPGNRYAGIGCGSNPNANAASWDDFSAWDLPSSGFFSMF